MAEWEKNAISDLREYPYIKASIDNISDEIDMLKHQAVTIRSVSYDKTPVMGGTSGREDALINNIDRRGMLEENLVVVKRRVEIIERGLNGLTEKERKVLDGFYINRSGDYVDRLSIDMGYEKSQVYRIKDDALKKYTLSRFGVIEL